MTVEIIGVSIKDDTVFSEFHAAIYSGTGTIKTRFCGERNNAATCRKKLTQKY